MSNSSIRFEPVDSQSNAKNSFDIIIIGTGLAGYTLAREIRKLDKGVSLLMVSRDDGSYYSKPMLSNGLAKDKSAEDLAAQKAQAMSDNLLATIVNYAEVSSVNCETKSLCAAGVDYHYENLVIATGAQQIELPIKGDGVTEVLSVNDLEDYAIFRERLEGVTRVAVMGPGLIGCEFANDLASSGRVTCIIGPDQWPLERMLPQAIGDAVQQALTELGVEWYLNTFVQQIDKSLSSNPSGYQLTLSNGDIVEAQLVVSAAGLKPDLAVAQLAGLNCNRGIVVNRQLQSSQNCVYSLGDCAEVVGLVLPYVAPIMHAAKALAHNLLIDAQSADSLELKSVSYPAMPVVIKTPAYPLVVASPPPDCVGGWQLDSTDEGLRALFKDEQGLLQGFVLGGKAVSEKAMLGRQLPVLLA